jgi:hypothetical protein
MGDGVSIPLRGYPTMLLAPRCQIQGWRLPTATRSGINRSPKHSTNREVIVPT